jgi:hypothetical protein
MDCRSRYSIAENAESFGSTSESIQVGIDETGGSSASLQPGGSANTLPVRVEHA